MSDWAAAARAQPIGLVPRGR